MAKIQWLVSSTEGLGGEVDLSLNAKHTKATYNLSEGGQLVFLGEDFKMKNGELVDGSVDRVIFKGTGGEVAITAEGHYDAAKLGDAAAGGSAFGLYLSLFGGNDTVIGSDGDDTLVGLRGDDMIFGGKGADTIAGGRGDDELSGGKGVDYFSMPSTRQFMIVAPFMAAASCITQIEVFKTSPFAIPAVESRHLAFCRKCRRQLRQRSRRNYQRSLHGPGHPSTWALAQLRSSGVR